MREVTDSDLSLLVDGRKERSSVVDAEVENAMLIGRLEGDAEDGSVCGLGDGREVQALEWGEHAEFELDLVVGGWDKRSQVIVRVFRDFDLEVLPRC